MQPLRPQASSCSKSGPIPSQARSSPKGGLFAWLGARGSLECDHAQMLAPSMTARIKDGVRDSSPPAKFDIRYKSLDFSGHLSALSPLNCVIYFSLAIELPRELGV